MTATLQLDEPGTAYCPSLGSSAQECQRVRDLPLPTPFASGRAYDVDPGSNVTFADVVAAPGGPFRWGTGQEGGWACRVKASFPPGSVLGTPCSFDLPSDSPLRSFTASAQRNFEITVTGLSREVGVWDFHMAYACI